MLLIHPAHIPAPILSIQSPRLPPKTILFIPQTRPTPRPTATPGPHLHFSTPLSSASSDLPLLLTDSVVPTLTTAARSSREDPSPTAPTLAGGPQPTLPAPCCRAPKARSAPPVAASRAALAGAGAKTAAGATRPSAEPHPPGGRVAAAAARGSGSASSPRLGPAGVSTATAPAWLGPGPQRCRGKPGPRPTWPGGHLKPPAPGPRFPRASCGLRRRDLPGAPHGGSIAAAAAPSAARHTLGRPPAAAAGSAASRRPASPPGPPLARVHGKPACRPQSAASRARAGERSRRPARGRAARSEAEGGGAPGAPASAAGRPLILPFIPLVHTACRTERCPDWEKTSNGRGDTNTLFTSRCSPSSPLRFRD